MAARRREVPILRARGARHDLGSSRPPPPDSSPSDSAARTSSTPPRPPSGAPPTGSARLGSPVIGVPVAGRTPTDALRPGWTDDLLVGEPRIDRQHKRFFLHAMRLALACEEDRGAGEIEAALGFLREYAAAHFADEEERMREVAYPYLASHAEAHASFLRRLSTLETQLAAEVDKRAIALDIAYMAASWFAEHVRQVDRLVARFLATAPPP